VSNTAGASALLFGRACTAQVGSLILTGGAQGFGLRVAFDVKRGVKVTQGVTKPQPNTCDVKIWNLSTSHQKELEQSTVPGSGKKVVPVIISAGYKSRSTQVFAGELRAAHTITDGADDVTELTTGDGDQALTQTRLTIALGPGATARQGIESIVKGLGVGEGNLSKAITLLQSQPLAAQLFAKGVVLKGAAADIMTDFCRSAGLDWSIQNGALQITELGQPVAGLAVLLDSDHGLIGSPTVDTTGLLSCVTEMIPDMFPGTKLSINAKHVQGGFRVLAVRTRGDTFGAEWRHEIEAVRY
jgi:hypothetical protein